MPEIPHSTTWTASGDIEWTIFCPNEGLEGDVLFSRKDPKLPNDPTEGFTDGSFVRKLVYRNELPPYGILEKKNIKRRRKKLCLLVARDRVGRKCNLDIPYFILKVAVAKLYIQPRIIQRMENLSINDIFGLNDLVKSGRMGRGDKPRKLLMKYVWEAAFGLKRIRARTKIIYERNRRKDEKWTIQRWVKEQRRLRREQTRLEGLAKIEAEHRYLTYREIGKESGGEGHTIIDLRPQAGRVGPGPGGQDPPSQPEDQGSGANL